ncbi:MAG TPA: hypothetical protein VGX28_04855 [Frankiaceae bacterium]|jgi:hypothetical protein|nr:hypothetical protein [Frankiaceae bacterium]
MTHDDARVLLSAVADGEAATTPDLDAHLASCAECAAYASGIARLSTLAAALPREPAPALAPRRARGPRRLVRWVPALAVATAAAVALTVLPAGDATFPAPPAAAAEPLRRLRSVYLERTVTGADGEAFERIWFRAPASLRIERSVDGGPVETRIETPGTVYADGAVTTGAPPAIPLPEPLSPTVSLLGRDLGPGPVVAGRATRRVVLAVGEERREAFVDVERALALGGDEVLVLTKLSSTVTKRVTRVDVDPAIPDDLFTPPASAPRDDAGFVRGDLGDLAPRALPRGFEPVLVGRGPDGESALYADGSLPLLVTSRPIPQDDRAATTTRTRGERTYLVHLRLYAPPEVELARDGLAIRIQAPLPVDSLIDLAERMYAE